MLGQVLWLKGRNAEATAAFRKGISKDPELPELHNSLAALLLDAGDSAGAEKEFREAMRIQPRRSQPRRRGNCGRFCEHGNPPLAAGSRLLLSTKCSSFRAIRDSSSW